ncbi:MAG: hypothetical protein QOJ95_5604 [Mycobacterium sp.]|jgi:hypothetical protein|nr:hypothetical protein [Mycobacterium sp.]
MTEHHTQLDGTDDERWLRTYYLARGTVSAVWIVAAFIVGSQSLAAATALLVVYPAWDAAANYWDASRNGGMGRNRTQAINVAVSLVTTVAVALALFLGMNWVLGVFGAWATLSGLLQLGTAVRRWKGVGAQWAMILSGGQSAIVGGFFIAQARAPLASALETVAGYAAMGAVYFLISAAWLTVKGVRRKSLSASR